MAAQTDRLIKGLALVAGLSVGALALLGWRVPASERALGTDVSLEARQPGELRVEPRGRVAFTRDLRPGGPSARSELTVANAADLPLAVAVFARPGDGEASRFLELELRAGGRVLARGPLESLGRPSRRRFTLSRRGSQRVQVSAWLPASAGERVRGRLATAGVRFEALARGVSR